MMDLSFFQKNGYQVLKQVINPQIISSIHTFLQTEKEKTLNCIQQSVAFSSHADLCEKIAELLSDESNFKLLDHDLRNMLSGHLSLESRLNPILHLVPKDPLIQEICRQLLPNKEVRLHLPPTARFVLPNNVYAATPAHQDISYNKHVEDFFVLWIPYCKIDEQCGGVIVQKDTGNLPEQLSSEKRQFWLNGIPDLGYEKIHCTMEAGDALLLNKWIIHQSAGNTSDRIRYSSDFRFFCGNSSKHYLDMKSWKVVAPNS